ncbi:SDR family oxidoreductase [Sedimentibacter sp. zth1]|uniref:SDR family NAD(P)-dependent oxidoreductase n=1 Tax=Sedimentibacter sp. zth1 TaxID=2816908 RepID=UPI001A92FBCF|nr:SDR family oxidoreductase [Sedimentibacter sp. zth1]QSX06262.1 SDR family oxidoreductase [Sedimentibacter sp. zth1]
MKKTALITGATSGLGLAYVNEYAKRGYDLIITGRRKEKIEANAKDIIERYGISVMVVIVDLSNENGLNKLLEIIKDKEIDVLVNNAGFGLKPYFADLLVENIEEMIYLQTNTVVLLVHTVIQGMIKRNHGTIINISSDGAFAVIPKNVLYSSTKIFIKNFTEGIYMELMETEVKVQVVCPGFMDSDFHESTGMKVNKSQKGFMKFSQPEDIVKKAMKDLKKGKVVSVLGTDAKLIRFLSNILPRKVYYFFAVGFVKKKFVPKNV